MAVDRLVPFVHVADVEDSLAFYALLGFSPDNAMRDAHDRAFWALAKSGKAEIMLARASGPVDADQQAVLFYMYSADIAALREHLLASGLRDGGAYTGARSPDDAPRTVYKVQRRDYMKGGEMRIIDPDGYVILVGQLE
jgi:hypothetical protein